MSTAAHYPVHLTRSWPLIFGQSLTVRPVRWDDAELERAFAFGLSRQTVYQRFFSAGFRLTRERLAYFTQIDYVRHMAYAATAILGGEEHFIAVGRYVVTTPPAVAEAALTVADAWQGRGLGRRMLETLIEHARGAGVQELAADVLATNAAMLRLAANVGFTIRADAGNALVRRIRMRLDQPADG